MAATFIRRRLRYGLSAEVLNRARASATQMNSASMVKDKVHVRDLHARYCISCFDHTKRTYQFQGRPFRLTDVAGNWSRR